MNGHKKTPDEREVPELTDQDWAVVEEKRKYVYDRLRAFGERVLKRRVIWVGKLGNHQWRVMPYRRGYGGMDAVSMMEDLEYRALEAAAKAVHDFDPNKGITLDSFMAVVIDRKLQSELDALTSKPWEEDNLISLEDVDEDELSYLDEHDQPETSDGLDEATREKLQAAMGSLSSREAWALRMKADGLPNDVIAERLGFKGEKSVFKIIAEARRKAQGVWDA